MRQLRLLGFLFFCLPFGLFAQKTALESQRIRFEAMVKKDSSTLEKILDKELTYLHSNGLFETKEDFINSIMSGKLVYKEILLENNQIRRTGRIAVIQGAGRFTGLMKNNQFSVRLKYISVYKKIKKRWKLIAWQSLKVDA